VSAPRAPNGRPIFIGIASQAAVDRYLAQTSHEEISDVHGGPFAYDSARRSGSAAPGVPDTAGFWAAQASGGGTQSLTWKPSGGRWVVVVMNGDGSPRVAADVSVAAKSGAVLPVGIGLLGIGVLAAALSGVMIGFAVREPGGPGGVAAPAATPAEGEGTAGESYR
jgi:hypothetical protein